MVSGVCAMVADRVYLVSKLESIKRELCSIYKLNNITFSNECSYIIIDVLLLFRRLLIFR